jgi:hypothetical protein
MCHRANTHLEISSRPHYSSCQWPKAEQIYDRYDGDVAVEEIIPTSTTRKTTPHVSISKYLRHHGEGRDTCHRHMLVGSDRVERSGWGGVYSSRTMSHMNSLQRTLQEPTVIAAIARQLLILPIFLNTGINLRLSWLPQIWWVGSMRQRWCVIHVLLSSVFFKLFKKHENIL